MAENTDDEAKAIRYKTHEKDGGKKSIRKS